MVKRGLGKSFDALIPTDLVDESFDPTAAVDEKVSDLRVIRVSDISPNPDQPRRHFDEEEMATLADSIREHGILQPIVVVPKSEGKFEIVAGERRWRAAKMADLTKIPAIVRTLSAQHKLELSIIENVQRTDLNPLETATGYVKLKTQFNLSDAEISARVGRAVSTITNQMRLLSLPDFVKTALVEGKITEGHARQFLTLASLGGGKQLQQEMLDLIIKEHWTVRNAEQFVIGFRNNGGVFGDDKAKSARSATKSENDFTRSLAKKLQFKPNQIIQETTAHGGKIIIKFTSDEELEKIRAMIL
ncbi:ParB/RepB/Spo0J family partition protein [Candidatus Saccharibacteria bacterium]|nr:ParB/RepB/Spo0J family partition protein [Candidatus Saccharibacteria bacterium]MCL1962789.1 ParB/RepB/Spo0J family partition protein [Candidatus Saccharibacteria bacterium]